MLHANMGDIKHVVVDGVFKKRNGRLVVDGYEALQDRFLESARRIQGLWGVMPAPVLEGVTGAEVEFERTVEMDVRRGKGTGYGGVYVEGHV